MSQLSTIGWIITSFYPLPKKTSRRAIRKKKSITREFLKFIRPRTLQQSFLTASEILNITQEMYGPKSQNLINPLNNLASSYFMIGDFDQAIKLFLECIALIESKKILPLS
ncbi:MAG: hypothetical protein Ct9H300mP4_12740 [Gammaproteobacteria bacterium]|nr:MAG: hypothetical protein Ct9H300mP4_12740 [Gammaproteobacteria bacterium]